MVFLLPTAFAQTEPIFNTMEILPDGTILKDGVEVTFVKEWNLTEYSDSYYIDMVEGAISVNKSSGAITIFNEGGNISADSDSFVVRGAEVDTDVWFNLSVNDVAPTVSVVEYDEYVYVDVIRENDEGLFRVNTLVSNDSAKTTAFFTNGSQYTNHKFAFTETLNLPSNILKLNSQDIDLNLFAGQSFNREVLEENRDLILEIQGMNYYSGVGFDDLWQVNLHEQRADGQFPISLDYANTSDIKIHDGQEILLDPVWSFSIQPMVREPRFVVTDSSDNIYYNDAINGGVSLVMVKTDTNGSNSSMFITGAANGAQATFAPMGMTAKGATIDVANGDIYLFDWNVYTWYKINSSGNTVYSKNIPYGTGAGQLRSGGNDVGAAVNSSYLYLTNTSDYRVDKWHKSNGNYAGFFTGSSSATYPTSCTAPDALKEGQGLAIDSNGNVYVADTACKTVNKYNSSGTLLYKLGTAGVGQGSWCGGAYTTTHFCYPNQVSVDPLTDDVYVGDYYRILKFNSSGTYLSQFGSQGLSNSQFTNVNDIDINSSGEILVADHGSGLWSGIKKFINVTPPSAPTNLTTSQSIANQIILNWTAPSSGSPPTSYEIYANSTLVATTGNVTTYTHNLPSNLIGQGITYMVEAINSAGSATSGTSLITAWNTPDIVTGFQAVTGYPITMSWVTPLSDDTITNFNIYRDGTLLTTLGNVNSYSDSATVSGTSYVYTASAVSAVGEGNQSSSSTALHGVAPDAPSISSLVISPTNLDIAVNISHGSSMGTGNFSNFSVERSVDGVTGWSIVGTPTGFTLTDTVPNVGTWHYRAQSISNHGTSVYSGIVNTSHVAPDAPTISTAITNPNTAPLDIEVSITNGVSNGTGTITNYEIYRDGTLVATTGVVSSYIDTVPSGGGTFVFEAKTITNHGVSVLSTSVSQTTATPPPAPISAPTLIIANPNPSPLDVTVSFAMPSSGGSVINSFEIFRSIDNVTFSSVGTTTTLLFYDTVPNAGSYYYTFASTNLVGSSGQSPSSSIATATVPLADASVTLAINNPNPNPLDITVSFVAPTSDGGSAVTGYNLSSSPDDITYTQIATGVTTPQTITVANAGTWYFKSQAINNVGTAGLGVSTSITTATVPSSDSSITLAINNPNPSPFIVTSTLVAPISNGGSTVTGYNLYHSSDDITYTSIATAINGTFDYTVSGVGTHYFKSEAINNVGTATQGLAVSIATPNTPDAPTLTLTTPSPDVTPLVINSSFVAPLNNGGSTVTGYNLYSSPDDITYTQIAINQTIDQTITVVSAGTYYFKAESISNAGTGSLSSAFSFATPTVPDGSSVSLVIATPNTTPLTFTITPVAPVSNGGSAITGYDLFTSPDGITYTQISTNVTTPQITTVANAGTWYFKSQAINLIGTGALGSAVTMDTPTVPSVPLNATSTISNINTAPYTMIVSWDTPTSNGGSNLTGYDVYRKQGSASPIFITNTTALTITDIVPTALSTNFTYQIYSVNNVGQSATYVDTVVTTNNVPSAPALNFTTGTTSLSWTAPFSDATITGYKVFRDSVLLTTVTTLTHTDWTPITFGQSYTYEVKAVSVLGDGVSSNNVVIMPETEITGMISSGITGKGAVIDWDAPAYYQGNLTYNVWYVTPSITTGTPTISAGTTLNTYSNFSPQLDYNTSYTFGVTITSPLGNSGFSNLVTLTTNVDGSIVSSDPLTGGMGWFDIDSVSEASLDVIEFQRETQLVPPTPVAGTPQVLTDTLQVAYPSWWDNMTCNVDYKFAQKTEQYIEGTDMISIPVPTNADRQIIGFSFQDVDNEVITIQCAPQQSSEGDEGSGIFVMTQNNLGTVGTIGTPNIPLVTMIAGFSNGSYGTDGDFGALNIVGLFAILISMVGFNRVSPIVGVILSASLIFALAWFGIVTIPTVIIGTIALVIFLAWGANRQR